MSKFSLSVSGLDTILTIGSIPASLREFSETEIVIGISKTLYDFQFFLCQLVATGGTKYINETMDKFSKNLTNFVISGDAQIPKGDTVNLRSWPEVSEYLLSLKTVYGGWSLQTANNLVVTPVLNSGKSHAYSRAIFQEYSRKFDGKYITGVGILTLNWKWESGNWRIVEFRLDKRLYNEIIDPYEGVVPYTPY